MTITVVDKGIPADEGGAPGKGLKTGALGMVSTLAIVGSTGEGPVVGTILGSVPCKLLHRSRVPVVVVPAED